VTSLIAQSLIYKARMVPIMPNVPTLYPVEIIKVFLVKCFEVRVNITKLRKAPRKFFIIKRLLKYEISYFFGFRNLTFKKAYDD